MCVGVCKRVCVGTGTGMGEYRGDETNKEKKSATGKVYVIFI